MHDPMQFIFDGAEAAQGALHSQAGCETALRMVLDRVAGQDAGTDQIILALIDSMAHFRATATTEVKRMQAVSMGRVQ